MELKMSILLRSLLLAAALISSTVVIAEPITGKGSAKVSIKENKGDVVVARRLAKDAAESDAIVAAIKLKLNVNPNDPKSKAGIADLVKQLSDNLKTTFVTEGDVLTAKTSLEVDASQLFDLAKSLGLGSQTKIAAAKVLFVIDEYAGIATSLEPGQPIETEMEFFQDKSSFSDKSAKASGSESNSQSAQSANAYTSKEASASSSKDSVAVKTKDSASLKTKDAVAVNSKDRVSGSREDSASASNRNGRADANSKASGSASSDYSGKASSEYDGRASSEYSGAASSSKAAASSSQKAGASSNKSASASASAYSTDQKDITDNKDVTSLKIKTKFPDVNNAKPSQGGDELIAARLEEVAQKYNLQFTSERDFRVEGGRKLLIKDIEALSKFDYYLQKASKGSFGAKYLVYGTAVMNTEGKTASGEVACSGQLKVQSSNVDTGASLASGTINKRAIGSSDQSCKANLSTALATSLAETIGTTAQREIQRVATQGESFQVTLYSVLKVPAKVRRSFTEQLQKMSDEFAEGNVTDSSREFIVQAKGNFKTKLEDAIEDMKEGFPEMKDARVDSKGNRVVICIEGKCP
jgi:hypothetical protein